MTQAASETLRGRQTEREGLPILRKVRCRRALEAQPSKIPGRPSQARTLAVIRWENCRRHEPTFSPKSLVMLKQEILEVSLDCAYRRFTVTVDFTVANELVRHKRPGRGAGGSGGLEFRKPRSK